MIFIAHRGNIHGPNPKSENNPVYLWAALHSGYNVEADVWYDKGWWLGHNKPQYKCVRNDLLHFWCHAKNAEALWRLRDRGTYHCFWQEKEDYVLTSNGHIWVFCGKPLLKNSICVLPEQKISGNIKNCYGICSDYVERYKEMYK